MKNTLLILLLSAAASQAQPSGAEPSVPGANSVSNREDALRQALHQALEGKAPLVAQNPVSNAPTSPAPLPAPGAAPAAVPPPVIPGANPVVVTTTNPPVVVTTNPPLPGVPVVLPAPAAPGAVPIPIPTAAPTPAAIPGAQTIPPRTIPAVPAPTTPAAVPAPTAPAPAVAVPAPAIPEEIISAGVINFQGADIKDVLIIYAELVNRTILRPTQLPAPTITLKTQTPLTKKEAIQALDAVLGMNGIGMVNIGEKFVKAVPLASVGQTGAPRSKAGIDQLPDIGPFVTHVVQLKYAKPTEMVAALQPFASPIPNPILPIDSSQILILRDFSENVKRMLEMVADIDVAIPSEYDSQVIPIKYALASEIASALNSLSSGGGGTTVGGGTTGGAGGTRSTSGSRFGTGGAGGYNRPGGGSMGYPGQTQPGYNPTAAGANPTTPGAPGSSFTDRLQNIIRRASVTGDINVIGQTKIIADERTNSLLIFATKEDMKIIKDIVAKLDIVLAQVLIEAVVLEVDISSGKDLGISYLQRPVTSGNFSGIGAIGKPFFTPGDFAPVLGGATNTAAALKGGFSYLATFGDDLDVSVTALANDSRAKILQRPRIQTSHAVQATLFVGESRPYPTASYYGGGAYGSYSSIQQLQIGVTLDVTPLINPDGLVVMDIHQTIENYAGFTEITGVGQVPNTTRKEAAAKVAVRDHDTIMLGGLIETTKSKTGSGVPFLMDIPLLGYLFRSTSASEKRTELIVLIRPTVLPTPEIAALTAKAEKDKMPGVRGVEDEIRSEEQKRLKQADKERKNY